MLRPCSFIEQMDKRKDDYAIPHNFLKKIEKFSINGLNFKLRSNLMNSSYPRYMT